MSLRVVIIAKGLPILWRKTFAADATIDAVIREFCSRQRLTVDTCILEHAGHPLGCGVRLDQIDTSGPALLQLEASTATSLAVYVAHLLQSLPDNQGSAQWSKAIAAYSPSDTFICGRSALQLLSDAADAQPSATVADINFDMRLNMKPANFEPLIQLCQYLMFGTDDHSAAAESPAVAVRAQADADSAEADIRCLLDLVVANRHCREFPATKLNLPEVSALTGQDAGLRQTKAKGVPKKAESVESEADTFPTSLHVFHGGDYLSFEKLESGEAAVVVLEGTSPGSTVTGLRIACYDDKDRNVEGVSGSIQVSWSKDRRVAQFQEDRIMVSLPDLKVPLQTTGVDKHWIQFDMDNILGPPLRVNIHIQPALPSSGALDNSTHSQTLPSEQSSATRQELQLPKANQHISSSRLASLVLVQDEHAVRIKKGINPDNAFIAKAQAGGVLHGLAFYGCDQTGQPLQDGVEGTVELSWRPGPQKAFLDHALLCLPDIQVPTRLGTTLEWIKFIPNDSPAVCSQLRLIVKAVAGEPVSCCMVAASTQTSTAAELQTSNGNLPEVVGNQPFDMEVFAVDKHGNRCHLYYAWDITCLSSHTVKTLEHDRTAVYSSNKCFSHIVTGLLAQEADSRNQTLISMLRPGDPCSKPILLMLASEHSVHPPLAAELVLQWALLVISCTRETCQKQGSERCELQREEAYYAYMYQQANLNKLDPGLKASMDSSMREQQDQRARVVQIISDLQLLQHELGSKKTAGKSHMEELLSLFEALTEKRLVPTSDTLGLKQIFQLADKGLADPDTEEYIAISAATNGDRLMAEEEQAAAKAAAKKTKRLKQKARSKQKQAAAQTLSDQSTPLALVAGGKQQQPAAEPLQDEFSRLLANFVARSDPTSVVATQADAAVMPTHVVAASSQHQVACGSDLAAGPCVQAQPSPSAQAELSSNPEASNSNAQPRSSLDKDDRDDFLNALFRCPITKAVMVDPVIAADGHTYERKAIEQRLQGHTTSPVSGRPLSHLRLVTNVSVKNALALARLG